MDETERQVARLPEAATEEIVARYEKAARLIRSQIAGAVKRGALGTATERRKQLAAIKQILDEVKKKTDGLGVLATGGAYNAGATVADESIEANLPEVADDLIATAFAGGPNRAALVALQLSMESKLDDALQEVGRSAED